MDEIEESKEHAAMFAKIPTTAAKRFSVVAKIEQRHAQQYQDALATPRAKQALQNNQEIK